MIGARSVERPDGPPLTVPIWYSYEPGGDVTVLAPASSLKGRLLYVESTGDEPSMKWTMRPDRWWSVDYSKPSVMPSSTSQPMSSAKGNENGEGHRQEH